ncbi:MAG: AraC family transcriptional regulator [Planctomycetota bacterium]
MQSRLPLRATPAEEAFADNGLWIFASRHDSDWTMDPTTHSFWKLLYFIDGGARILMEPEAANSQSATAFAARDSQLDQTAPTGDRERAGRPGWDCRAGDCVLIPPERTHRIVDQSSQPVSLYGMGVRIQATPDTFPLNDFLSPVRLSSDRLRYLGLPRRLRKIWYLQHTSSQTDRLAALTGALDLLACVSGVLSRHGGQSPSPARDAEPDMVLMRTYVTWLEENFFEPLTIDSGAEACGVSRRKFTSLFRKVTGETWLSHLNRIRVNHAKQLLTESDLSVASIAFQVGYEELSTFYRAFRRVTGRRPAEIRDSKPQPGQGHDAT